MFTCICDINNSKYFRPSKDLNETMITIERNMQLMHKFLCIHTSYSRIENEIQNYSDFEEIEITLAFGTQRAAQFQIACEIFIN